MHDAQNIYYKENASFFGRRRRRKSDSRNRSYHVIDRPDTELFTDAEAEKRRKRRDSPTLFPEDGASGSFVSSQTHRHRHHRRSLRDTPNLAGKIAGILLAIVAIGYGAVLFNLRVLHRARPAAAPAAPAAEAAPQPAAATDAETTVRVQAQVRLWERQPSLVRETARLLNGTDVALAIKKLDSALAIMPDAVELKILLARGLFATKEYGRSVDLLIEALNATPYDEEALKILATALYFQKNYPAALTIADYILQTDRDSMTAHQIAAGVYVNTDRISFAIPHLKAMVTIEGENPVSVNNLGLAYIRIGQLEKAAEVLGELLRRNAATAVTYYNLATVYARLSKGEEAVKLLSSASAVYGAGVVRSWTPNSDFDNIRGIPLFKNFEGPAGDGAADTNAAQALMAIDPFAGDDRGILDEEKNPGLKP